MGKKLESSFKNMVLVLFLVTLVSSAAVGVVNSLTSGLIEKVKIEKQVQAIRAVVPAFDNDPMTEKQIVEVDGGKLEFYPAKANGQLVGTAIKTFTNNGFSGLVELMGSKMDAWFVKGAKGDITGKTPGSQGLQVSKDGGDVDAITAATISSRAFLDAVNRAAKALAESAK